MPTVQSLVADNLDIWTTAIQKKASTGRGSGKKISLYGVKKLRELILELAVRGKIVTQDLNDEPASVLLKQIAAKKEKMVEEGIIKEQKQLPPFNDDEKSCELPEGWEWTRLGNIAEINPRNNAEDDLEVSFIPMSLITTSYCGAHDQETKKWREIKAGYTHFADGDIAVAKITPCFENSKAAVFNGLENGLGAGTTELHVARPYGDTINRRYVLLYLKAPQFLIVGQKKMTGTAGQKRVPKDFFERNPLPLPPLSEQHRIVDKVDELMVLCDQLEQQTEDSITAHQTLVETLLATLTESKDAEEFAQNWSRVAEHFDTLFTTEDSIDQLKQTILQLAVMGKLVPQDTSQEPASALLRRIATEKARQVEVGKIKKQKPLPPISDDGKPFELPQDWEWVRMAEVASFENGDRSSRYPNDSDLVRDGVPFFGAKDMIDGTLRFDNDLRLISEKKFSELSNGKLCHKDFVILLRGMVGKMALFNESEEYSTGFINAQMLIIRLLERSMSEFFNIFFASSFFQSDISKKITGTAVKQMPARALIDLIVPIPPITEQHRIVAKVEELMALCDQLKARLSNAQDIQLHLADAIVEQAVT
jgi:type I restriction enzyme, S subunit